ncbi:uncharacterized protein LOC124826200 isoform X3 [Vigna umbellata]|uniref:uncharacterized protein LOC124826200 isoform X3 n=1 Tax=Vigna umbellata TaxID=87088 RepID=UPI001F5E3C6A|nr:uncharacterized protein LOC124826200 isoform X3 [Vigna umbellata]
MVATAATFFNSQFLHTHGRINIWRLNRNSNFSENVKFEFPIHRSEFHHQVHLPHLAPICATFKGPKGFGPSSQKKKKKSKKIKREYVEDEDEDDDDDEEEEPDRGVIPEIVTNRMMNRMAVSVGIPLGKIPPKGSKFQEGLHSVTPTEDCLSLFSIVLC